MLLAQPRPDCTIVHEADYIRAQVGPGRAQEIQECYRALAALTLEHKFRCALIVGLAADDPIHQLTAPDAVIAFHVIGVPAGFRLAFVARSADALDAFRHAEIEATNRGLRAKVFADEADAVRWLSAPELH